MRSSMCESCAAIAGANSATTARVSEPTSVGSVRSSSEPASRRERSSRSVASFCRRSVCWRTWRMNARRVSSSRSSSSSSSRKPPSENSGVRSSCDAVAMNRLRAESSWASWPCMSSSAWERLPSSSSYSGKRVGEVAARHAPRALLQRLDAPRDPAGDDRARDEREQQAETARHEDLSSDQRDVVGHVGQRRGEDDDATDALAGEQRLRGLTDPAVVGPGRPADDLALGDRLVGDRAEVDVGDVGLLVGVRDDVGVGRLGRPDGQERDARRRALRAPRARWSSAGARTGRTGC